jgi:hypothetical protein
MVYYREKVKPKGVSYMNTWKELEGKIDNTVELSTICRKEWCRLLETDMDVLTDEFHDFIKSGEVHEKLCYDSISRNMMKGYRNVGPFLRVYS